MKDNLGRKGQRSKELKARLVDGWYKSRTRKFELEASPQEPAKIRSDVQPEVRDRSAPTTSQKFSSVGDERWAIEGYVPMTWLTPSHRTCQRPKAHQSHPGARQLRVLRVRLACTTTWEARSIRMGPTPRWSPVAWRLVAATSRLGWRRRGPRNAGMYRYLAWQHSPPGEFGGVSVDFGGAAVLGGLPPTSPISHQCGQCVLGHDLRPSASPLWGRSAAC